MLVICLLAASFTGCLGSDDIVDEVPVEEETIEPVGTGDNGGNETNNYYYNNDTYYVNGTDYLELISQVENLTVEVEELTIEVEELTDAIEEMQSSKYDVPENSSIWIQYQYEENRDIEIIKNGSTITVEYRGDNLNNYLNTTYPRNCTIFTPGLSFYNSDGVMIKSFSAGDSLWHDEGGEFWMDGVEIIRECAFHEDYSPASQDIRQYWSTIVITLPEEPTRIDTGSGYYTFY